MPCEPAPPCEPTFPIFCEALPLTTNGQRVVVEDAASCQKTIAKSSNPSLLHQTNTGNLKMSDGSSSSPIKLPQMDVLSLSEAPKIMVLLADGTVKAWEPSSTGEDFIAFWDGSNWKLGSIASIFPSGDGVLIKDGLGNISFINGSAGESLQYVGTTITFATQSLTPVPTGFILPFAAPITTVLPSGYLLCDGSVVSIATYGNLFATIGSYYNTSGEPSGTFRLPDLRGYFIRGYGTNVDGTASGSLGVKQQDSLTDHTHSYSTRQSSLPISYAVGSQSATFTTTSSTSATTGNVSAPNGGGTETRPKNIAMQYLIKT